MSQVHDNIIISYHVDFENDRQCVLESGRQKTAEQFNAGFHSGYAKYGECPGHNKTADDMPAGMREYQFNLGTHKDMQHALQLAMNK